MGMVEVQFLLGKDSRQQLNIGAFVLRQPKLNHHYWRINSATTFRYLFISSLDEGGTYMYNDAQERQDG